MPTISIEGKDCCYQGLSNGYPVLFGHSYLWFSEIWEPQISNLSKRFKCIVPEYYCINHEPIQVHDL